ncbi:amidohydrolase/deacetylase family metallohydrolase [Enterococcus sp. LJL98]
MKEKVLKGGRFISGAPCELAFVNGKIVEVAPVIDAKGREVIDITGKFLSAGWIDDHVHCYEEMDLYYDYPDAIGVTQGVTTVIDAGTTGAENIQRFYALAQKSKTNVYALLNISKWGIVEQDELADLTKIQEQLIQQAIKDLPDFIVGIKARMSKTVVGDNGVTPLDLAKKIQKENDNLPLMVHIGSAPPTLEEVLARLEAGDVLTHCFNGKPNGILDQRAGWIKPIAIRAYKKGLIFDIGHGTDSFNFHVAETALKSNIKAQTISTDIYIRNRENGPVYNLATTMEKLHVVGYTWEEIIEKVTSAPAKAFHLNGKGQLAVGYDADMTVFEFIDGEKVLTDSNGQKRTTSVQIRPVKTIIGGKVYANEL